MNVVAGQPPLTRYSTASPGSSRHTPFLVSCAVSFAISRTRPPPGDWRSRRGGLLPRSPVSRGLSLGAMRRPAAIVAGGLSPPSPQEAVLDAEPGSTGRML